MNKIRMAMRIAALSQPLSERYDYGTGPSGSLPHGEECECGSECDGKECRCKSCDHTACPMTDKALDF